MSGKEETVEVTVRIPKKLMDVLEAENYFGWSKEAFWVAAVKSRIGCDLSEMDIDEMKAVEAKYGKDISIISVDLVKAVKA